MTKKAKSNFPPRAYDKTPRLSITFTDESVWITTFDNRGSPLVTYPADVRNVANAFKDFGASTGLLPADTLWWNSKGGRTEIAIYLPPQKRIISYNAGKRFLQFTLPPLGCVFIGKGVSYSVFAATRRPTTDQEMLFHVPLPNVYTAHGSICAGSVQFPICSPSTIGEAARLFFESGFNSHVDGRKLQGTTSVLQALKELDGKEVFPFDRLYPALTIGALMRGQTALDTEDEEEPDPEWDPIGAPAMVGEEDDDAEID